MFKIDGYIIDVAIDYTESYEATVTEYPVERGGVISDHIDNAAGVLDITFKVSDTPIGEVAKARSANVVPSSEARSFLLSLRASKQPFTVEIDGKVFEDRVFESLEFPSDENTGAALDGHATLREIRIVNVTRTVVTIRDLGPRTAKVTDRYHIWSCPPPLKEKVGDDAYNERQGCRRINYAKVNGTYQATYADTGEALGDDGVRQLSEQFKDRSRNSTFIDPDTGVWMRNDIRAGRANAIPNQGDPFGIFTDPDDTFGVQTLPDEPAAPILRDRPEIGRNI